MASKDSLVLQLVARILNFLAAAITSDNGTEGINRDVILSMAGLAASSQGPTQPTASASTSTSHGVPGGSPSTSTPSPPPQHPSSSTSTSPNGVPQRSHSESTSSPPATPAFECGCPLVTVTVCNFTNNTGKFHVNEACKGLSSAGKLTKRSLCSALRNGQTFCSRCCTGH